MKLIKYTDEQLVELIHQGNKGAFKEIYERYWSRLLVAATKKVGSKEIVEEMIQDLFTDLWVRRESLQIQKNFSNYIYTALKNKILKHYQSLYTKKNHINYIKNTISIVDNSTSDNIIFNELNIALDKQISALPKRCREVYTLSRQESCSIKEIAQRLNISTNTVENQMSKALRVIRDNLKEFMAMIIGLITFYF
jgi:RNA polymerase sigma-70 factor (ECF subfamily)